jgi:predicted acetyltransferase
MKFANTRLNQIPARNSLLQETLRPFPTNYCISTEYPMVLDQNNLNRSFIGTVDNELVTHSNLWVRKCTSLAEEPLKVGIVGNVATSPMHQNKGYMKKMMQFIEGQALTEKCKAIILWSDLDTFYTKLGFKQVGCEKRYTIHTSKLDGITSFKGVEIVSPTSISNDLIEQINGLKCTKNPTLSRDIKSFSNLLKIPDTYLAIERQDNQIKSFAIIGKGADLVGVIHEWGYVCSDSFKRLLKSLVEATALPELMVIGPEGSYASSLLEDISTSCETKNMAYIKILDTNSEVDWANLYIWGLDSI